MGQFFKFLFASCLGVILAALAIGGISLVIFTKIASEANRPAPVSANSVLRLTFNDPIPEKTNNLEMDPFDLNENKILGVQDLVYTIETAKEDDRIKGIFLEVDGLPAGFATAHVLRNAILDFKESGKFVTAYSKYYSQGAYYVASAADKIHINPIGLVDFRGFAAQVPFFKEMLDEVGVKMQVFYAGKFKSATEPYRRINMSDENRLQVREFLNDNYDLFLDGISQSRNISIEQLKQIADSYAASDPEKALSLQIVDHVGYRDEAISDLKDRLGLGKKEIPKFISAKKYFNAKPKRQDYSVKNKIAVIYAEGTIVDGKGENGTIGDDRYTKIISKIRRDEKIKAIVLRVNSPGGSAMSSENIWREFSLFKETGKPIVVSMGDYAASGGYYISCMADKIVAEPNTLTGSIGVFSIIPSVSKLLNDKLKIHFDTVKTGKFSTGITGIFDMNAAEGKIMQNRTDYLYETFLKRVADGRKMTRNKVHEIAQGRVWTGTKAKEIGLVDKIGDLDDAIEMAAELADLDEYRLTEYPFLKDPLLQFIEKFTSDDDASTRKNQLIKSELGEWYPYYQMIMELRDSKGTQARLPFVLPFH